MSALQGVSSDTVTPRWTPWPIVTAHTACLLPKSFSCHTQESCYKKISSLLCYNSRLRFFSKSPLPSFSKILLSVKQGPIQKRNFWLDCRYYRVFFCRGMLHHHRYAIFFFVCVYSAKKTCNFVTLFPFPPPPPFSCLISLSNSTWT